MANYVQPTFNVFGKATFKNETTFDTSVNLSNLVTIDALTEQTGIADALVVSTNGANSLVKYFSLGTMASQTAGNYPTTVQLNTAVSDVDSSLVNYTDNTFLKLDGGTLAGLVTLDNLGFTLDGQNITTIDTSVSGVSELDTAIPTSAAVRSLVASSVTGAITADNGLTNTLGNIQLGGSLIKATTITTSAANTLSIPGLQLEQGESTVVAVGVGGELVYSELGTMAYTTASSYYTKTNLQTSGQASVHWGNITNTPTTLLNYGISDTKANFNTALSDGTFAFAGGAFHDGFSDFVGNEHIDHSGLDVTAGDGLTGGGTLTSTVTVTMGTPGALTASTTDVVSAASHTHSITGFIPTTDYDDFVNVTGDTMTGPLVVEAPFVAFQAQLGIGNASTGFTALPGNETILTYVNSVLSYTFDETGIKGTNSDDIAIFTHRGNSATVPYITARDDVSTGYGFEAPGILSLIVDNVQMVQITDTLTTFNNEIQVPNSITFQNHNATPTDLQVPDTKYVNDYNAIQDANILALDVSLGNYVKKTGDTMTGLLTITSGGLVVSNDVAIGGDLYVDGSLVVTNVESVDVSAGFIHLNTGLTGTPPATMQSGIEIGRGDLDPYVFLFDETAQEFRIGIANRSTGPSYDDASTQAVATRQDLASVVNNGVVYWNQTESRFDTVSGFTYNSGILAVPDLTLSGLSAQASELTALVINGSNVVGTRELGTTAFTNPVTATGTGPINVSGSNQVISAMAVSIDTANGSTTGALSSTDWTTFNNKINNVASSNSALSGIHAVYGGESPTGTALIKHIRAGAGITISETDSSSLTISSDVTSTVSKYIGTFNATGISTLSIPTGTHGLGVGPLTVSVYDGTELVYTGVDCAANGDITLDWIPTALGATCKYIITG